MKLRPQILQVHTVALLAEGVGRNLSWWNNLRTRLRSPSSRRAWVEIGHQQAGVENRQVALLAEGVGRNIDVFFDALNGGGRPPRGGRG